MSRLLVPLIILCAALGVLLSIEQPGNDADLIIASEDEIKTLDPQRMSWLHDMRLAYALYEGLTRWNTNDFTIEPAIAQSWNSSEDGLLWRFHIDPQARWSNGTPVTAHDFVWSWQRLLLPDTAADYSDLLFPVQGAEEFWNWRAEKLASFSGGEQEAEELMEETDRRFHETVGIRALDHSTLELQLARPVPYLLDLLAFAPLLPVHRPSVEGWMVTDADLEDMKEPSGWHFMNPPPWSERRFIALSPQTGRLQVDHRWARPGTLVSNGDYVLDRWRYRRDLRLTRNPESRRPLNGAAREILVVSIPDPNTALLAFRAGEVDWLTGVSADVRQDLLNAASDSQADQTRLVRSIRAIPSFGTDFFSFNCRPTLPDGRANPFHQAEVRRAFALATDKQSIVNHVTGLHEPISGSMSPAGGIKGYEPPNGLGFDPDAALRELASAGWGLDDEHNLRSASGELFPEIELLYTTSSSRHQRIATALRGQWEETLGVNVRLVGKDSKAFSVDLRQGDFMIARGRWYGDWGDPTTFLNLFRTGNGNNDRGFSNESIDAALAAADVQSDPAARYRSMAAVEKDLFEKHLPLLPICQIVEIGMYDPQQLSGMTTHPRLIQYLGDIRFVKETP